jgi:DegV family protein with EDD domain
MSDPRIAIVTDSSAYIPDELMRGLNIHVIPVWLIWDGKNYRDGIDIKPEEFYRRLKTSKTLPTTSQPSANEFEEFFIECGKKYDAIVAPLVSSKMSGTIACAQAAVNTLTDLSIKIIDTFTGSMAHGLIVLAAARAAAAGRVLDEVVNAAKAMREKVNLFFVVDTMEFLHRGGRISGAKRYLGTALQIRPILQFAEGTIAPLSQARTRNKAIEKLLDLVEERLEGRSVAEACVINIDCRADGESLVAKVKERYNIPLVHLAGVSPVVGTLVGPGGLGLAFYPND